MKEEHWLFKERRFGKFSIPLYCIQTDPYMVMQVLHEVIIFKAEYDMPSDSIIYHGLHPQFEPVPEGVMPLEYVALTGEDGVRVKFLSNSFDLEYDPNLLIRQNYERIQSR